MNLFKMATQKVWGIAFIVAATSFFITAIYPEMAFCARDLVISPEMSKKEIRLAVEAHAEQMIQGLNILRDHYLQGRESNLESQLLDPLRKRLERYAEPYSYFAATIKAIHLHQSQRLSLSIPKASLRVVSAAGIIGASTYGFTNHLPTALLASASSLTATALAASIGQPKFDQIFLGTKTPTDVVFHWYRKQFISSGIRMPKDPEHFSLILRHMIAGNFQQALFLAEPKFLFREISRTKQYLQKWAKTLDTDGKTDQAEAVLSILQKVPRVPWEQRLNPNREIITEIFFQWQSACISTVNAGIDFKWEQNKNLDFYHTIDSKRHIDWPQWKLTEHVNKKFIPRVIGTTGVSEDIASLLNQYFNLDEIYDSLFAPLHGLMSDDWVIHIDTAPEFDQLEKATDSTTATTSDPTAATATAVSIASGSISGHALISFKAYKSSQETGTQISHIPYVQLPTLRLPFSAKTNELQIALRQPDFINLLIKELPLIMAALADTNNASITAKLRVDPVNNDPVSPTADQPSRLHNHISNCQTVLQHSPSDHLPEVKNHN